MTEMLDELAQGVFQEAQFVGSPYDGQQLSLDNSECSSVIVSPTKSVLRSWSSHNGDEGPNTVL